MEFNLKIRELAANEIIDAFEWYEGLLQGLGYTFLEALDDTFQTLMENPFIFSYYFKPVRRAKLKKFPYLVVYEVFESEIVV